MSKQIAIEFKNYAFKYPNAQHWILDGVNFKLHYGEMVLLSGLSGEGKSTLLSSINGIIPHTIKGEQKGEIFISGKAMAQRHPSDIAKDIGSVLQNADSQIIHGLVEDEIAFGCENLSFTSADIEKRIAFACAEMNLSPSMFTRTLSGGQKQKVITATTLAMGQKILIFDEPLANLDLEAALHLLTHLKKCAQNGYAVFIVEHRIDVVLPYVDRALVLQRGALKEYSMKTEAIAHAMESLYDETNTPSPLHNEVLFTLEDIGFRVKTQEILKNISLKIYRGQRLVILGENGCGKTTLLKLISKLIQPSSGKYTQTLDLKTKKKPSGTFYKKLGFVYQNPNYQLFMPSVEKEVGFAAHSETYKDKMLSAFYLTHLKDQHPHSLSEGQKRRLTLASILAMKPEVLLLDEPTVGQDYEGLKGVVKEINTYHQTHSCTLITITHDFRCAKQLADRIIWMKKGEIYKIGGKELADEYASFFNPSLT